MDEWMDGVKEEGRGGGQTPLLNEQKASEMAVAD